MLKKLKENAVQSFRSGSKPLRRLEALLAALMLPYCAFAADLQQGDRGQEVRLMQQQLIDFGFLKDKADGIFGKKTAAAVKEWSTWLYDLPGDQVMDENEMLFLNDLWRMAEGLPIMDETDGEENHLAPRFCAQEEENGVILYCFRHLGEQMMMHYAHWGHAPEAMRQKLLNKACYLWTDSIRLMYAEWAQTNPDAAAQQLAIFEEAAAEHQQACHQAHDEMSALEEQASWLDAVGRNLCFDLYGAQGMVE